MQRGKVHRQVHLQPAAIPVLHCHSAHRQVDLVGPLPPSPSHTYLFTVIDRTSKWPEAILISSITTAEFARALFAGFVSSFGVPAIITSDRRSQFTSALWTRQLSATCSTSHTHRIPPPIKRPGGMVPPQMVEGCPARQGRRH